MPGLGFSAFAPLLLLLLSPGLLRSDAPGAEPAITKNLLLPDHPSPQPLGGAVFFAFDKESFPERENVSLELVQGANPRRVIPAGPEGSPDQHWGYFTLLPIGDMLRVWVMTSDREWSQHLCLARSRDGVQWEKPELGLVEFKGSRKNNIIESPFRLRSPGFPDVMTTFLVHHDPGDPRPERRFKMAAQLIQGGTSKLAIAFSPDGLRWKAGPEPKQQFMEMGGSVKFKDRFYLTGQSTMPRRLNVFSSPDFEDWTDLGSTFARDHLPPLEKEEPSRLPDADRWAPAGIGKGEQVHCGAGLWDRGNVILGVYDAWHGRERDRRLITMDLGLVISHDAVHFSEPVESFRLVDARKQPALPPYGPALTGGKLGNIGDQTFCWYTWWHPPEGQHGTYAVAWDRDRLGLLRPSGAGRARVVSAPVRITGGGASLQVNAGGLDEKNRLRVSLLDEQSRPLAGFSGPDAVVLGKDGLIPVAWKTGEVLSLPGTFRVQVDFEGMNPRLYALTLKGAAGSDR